MTPIPGILNRLGELGLTLPPTATTFGAYVPARQSGRLVFISGQLPVAGGTLLAAGSVPSACPIETARLGARQCVLNALAAANTLSGGVQALRGVVRIGVFVRSDPDFTAQPHVADAASDLLLEIFGEAGRHARAAVGVGSLPRDAAVEIEFVFETAEPVPTR